MFEKLVSLFWGYVYNCAARTTPLAPKAAKGAANAAVDREEYTETPSANACTRRHIDWQAGDGELFGAIRSASFW